MAGPARRGGLNHAARQAVGAQALEEGHTMGIDMRIGRGALLLAALVLAPAIAQDKYPSKPITVVVPQAPGGANDAIARIWGQKFSESIGQAVVIENKAGAGGNIGTVAAAKAPKDGYTLLLTLSSAHVTNPYLYKNAGFDPVKDFEPIAPVATAGYLLVAAPDFPANNVKELIELAKKKPGDISYGSAGNGTLNHLLGEMLKKQAGIDIQHVPYKGAAAALNDVMGGRVPISFQSVPSAISQVKSGKLKVLGVANEKRIAALPDVPAISETLPGYGATPWYGLFAPVGTPKDIIVQVQQQTAKVLADKGVQEKLALQGAEPYNLSTADFTALVKDELPRWQKIVKESGATVD
jgi:tripartite-type tricarboxylate transporter receptor subunit TctC